MNITPEIIFTAIIAIITFDFIVERVLSYLNLKNWKSELPVELSGIYNQDEYRKSSSYSKTKSKIGLISSAFNFVMILIILSSGILGWVDDFARGLFQNEILVALVFFGIIALAAKVFSLPFELYSTFVIEEKFGFNRTTPKIFILDELKSMALSIVLGGGILWAIMAIYMKWQDLFWLYSWVVITVLMVLISMFYSRIIVPLFNKQTPLEDGELKEAINAFAEKTGFKIDSIFVIDGGKRSTKANAYFTGFGRQKRIVLYDTLINDHSVEELVAVLAHEIGHYKLKHTIKGLITGILQTGILLFILGFFIKSDSEFAINMAKSLGAAKSSFHIGIIAFGLIFTPVSMIISLIMNHFSRKNEYAADKFAKDNFSGEHLATALKKLSKNNLSNLTPHPLYVIFYYGHPTLLQRLSKL